MADREHDKLEAARVAASLVESGMVVGLGSGTTSARVVEALGQRVRREGLRIVGVPTSRATAQLAEACGIHLTDLDDVPSLDMAIDGADEVDGAFRMIKGRGGALLREKIVAAASRLRVIAITGDKRVERLGHRNPVPVEVSAFGLKHTEQKLRNEGATTKLRLGADGAPFRTDEGHLILDCRFLDIADPEELNIRLNSLVGVFETGLFIGLCDRLVVGQGGAVEVIDRPPPIPTAV